MLTCYFGVPGSGKSSLLAMFAVKELRKIKRGKSKYKNVVSNFPIKGVTLIKTSDLGKYLFSDCLILLDELTLDVDARNYKNLNENFKEFIVLHRHAHNDIIYAVQDPSSVDKRIRDLTFDLHYLSRPNVPFGHSFIRTKRIWRNININEFTSELTLGYRFSRTLEAIINHANRVFYIRPFWKYFDSYDLSGLRNRKNYFEKGDTGN